MINQKPWLWLLIASLALNVFLGAAMGTHFFRGPKHPPRPGTIILDMAEALPEADARILRQAYEARRSELEDDTPRRNFDEIRRAMSAEPFDPAAFLRVTSEFHARQHRVHQVTDEILADALPRLSPEGRKRLAERPPPGDRRGPPPPRQ